MIKILVTLFLVLVSFNCISAEQFKTPEETTEDLFLGHNAIELSRAMVKVYSELTDSEKKEFLSTIGSSEEEFNTFKAICALDWKSEGKYKLPLSNSTLSIPNGYVFLDRNDAKELSIITGEPHEFLEGYVCEGSNFDNSIVFQNIKTGYISIDDWSELDSKELINQIIQNTENDNIERRKRGSDELHVIGWIQEPTLDRQTNTVYWSIEADLGGNEIIINSVAIRLGREGIEKITWVASRSLYVPFGGHLDVMLRAHSFDPGYRYDDYRTGDKVAGYGVAALVAATVGGKIVKAGGLLALLKKFGALILVGIAATFNKLKNIFRRDPN